MDEIQALHAVTEPTRFRILRELLRRRYCVRAVSKKLGISEAAVSQHMSILKKLGIVHGKKIGYQTHYCVDRESLARLANSFRGVLAEEDTGCAPERICSCEFVSGCLRREHPAEGGKSSGK